MGSREATLLASSVGPPHIMKTVAVARKRDDDGAMKVCLSAGSNHGMNSKLDSNRMSRLFFFGSLATTVFLYACGTSPVGNNQGADGGSGGKGAAPDGGSNGQDVAGNGAGGSAATGGAGGPATGGSGGGGMNPDGAAHDTNAGGSGGTGGGGADGGACPALEPVATSQGGDLIYPSCSTADQSCQYRAAFCRCQHTPGMDAGSALVWVCQPII
jgi:hypothetical protein